MTNNGPEHSAFLPDYRIDGRDVLSPEQQEFCEGTYNLICSELPVGLHPAELSAGSQEYFSRGVHAVLDRLRIERLPNYWVVSMLDSYYSSFPSARNSLTQDERIAYQDTFIPIARAHANYYSEVRYATALQHAFHARRQKRATAAMYGLLTAYGKAIAALNPR